MENHMKRAMELAELGRGFVNPNPLVGAVIVKDDRIIGQGYHKIYGENHAEINAFEDARSRGESVRGSTMYVTLEPCSHYGKTPPCAEAIVKHGVGKVVIGLLDPNPLVSGRGIEILERAGIEVEHGVLSEELAIQNEVFLKYIRTERPFCILKTAMTLDGKIATHNGDSRWITNSKSREYVHQIRQGVSAVMVGINTAIRDNPLLNTRLEGRECSDSVKVVVDSSGRIPLDLKLISEMGEKGLIVATTDKIDDKKRKALIEAGCKVIITPKVDGKVSLDYLMEELGKLKIDSVLLEGGGGLNYGALEAGIVDKVECFIAPKFLGGSESKTPVEGRGIDLVRDAIEVDRTSVKQFDGDILISGYIREM